MPYAEEERVLVVGKLDLFGVGVGQQLLQLLERLARNEHTLLAADAFEILVGLFDEGEAMAVGCNHGQRLGLDNQQGAVEGVARLLVGDGEDGARDEGLERDERDAGDRDRGELWNLGIIGSCHAHDFGVGAAAADLHPVVIKQLDGDIAIGQQLDVIVKFACRDGAGTRLFYLDRGTGANGLIKVSRGNVQAVIFSFKEKIRQDRNGGFALDHALCRREFSYQILAAYGNLHRCPLYGRLLNFGFTDWHLHPQTQKPDDFGGSHLSPWPHSTTHCGRANRLSYVGLPTTQCGRAKRLSFVPLDCIHPWVCVCVETRDSSLDYWGCTAGND